jgi:hypothetical protein
VPLKVYDETIRVLKVAVSKARLGREDELGALKRLDEQTRLLEHHASNPGVEELIAHEEQRSHLYCGRTVFGWARPSAAQAQSTLASPQSQTRSRLIGRDPDQRSSAWSVVPDDQAFIGTPPDAFALGHAL